MPLSKSLLTATMPRLKSQPALVAAYLPYLNAALAEFDISTPRRVAAWIAQVAHESGQLRYMQEIASGAAYEGRKDLGNTQRGDGKRYKGRGPIQLTGRANYRTYGQLLGLDLEGEPTRAADPDVAFRIAGLYWKRAGCNELADKGTLAAFKTITRKINGGLNGLEDRVAHWERAKKALATTNAAPATLAALGGSAEAPAGDVIPPVVAPVLSEAVAVEAAPVAAVPGGGPDDPAVKANKSSIVSKVWVWAGGAVASVGGLGGVTAAVGSVASLSPQAQLVLTYVVGALVVLGAFGLVTFLLIGAVGGVWDHINTKNIRADKSKQNVK